MKSILSCFALTILSAPAIAENIIIQITNEQTITLTVVPTSAKGQPTQIDGDVQWTSDVGCAATADASTRTARVQLIRSIPEPVL